MQVALDSETRLITNEAPVPELACVTYSADFGNGIFHANDPELEETITTCIEDKECLFSNPSFDLAVFGNRWDGCVEKIFRALDHSNGKGGDAKGNIHCVLIRDTLKHIMLGDFKRIYQDKSNTGGFSLGSVALRELGIHLTKDDWRLRYGELIQLPLEAWPKPAVEYAENDAISNRLIFAKQEMECEELRAAEGVDLFEDEHRQVRASFALYLMGIHGICVDQEEVARFSKTIDEQWEAAKVTLQKAGLVRLDGTRNMAAAQKVMENACKRVGIEPKLTDGGKVSLDIEACERVCDDVMDAFQNYGSLLKLKGTYIEPLVRAGAVPIRPYWNVLVDNGRVSCSRPNLTNLPRAPGVRECYIPRPGHKFISADYDKSEMVSWAQILHVLFGGSKIGHALNSGIDPHTMLAATFLGCSLEEAIQRVKDGDPLAVEARQTSKPPNFGFMGGMGWLRYLMTCRKDFEREVFQRVFAADPRGTAERHKQAWKATWNPDAQNYFDYITELTEHGPAMIRAYKSGRLRGGLGFSDCANAFFSQLMADYSKDALWRVTWRQYMEPQSALYGTHCVVFPHDEFIIEVPDDRVTAAARELEETMGEAQKWWCPDIKGGANAKVLDRWRKK